MVKVTVFAQYPTTKTINGTKVVIMTVSQADQIDNKFIMFTDSLKTLNQKLKSELEKKAELEAKVRELNNKPVVPICTDTIGVGRRLLLASYEIDSLKRENKRIEKLEFIEKKTRIKIYALVGIGVSAWVLGLINGFIIPQK